MHEPTQVVDILPTIEVTGVQFPKEFGGHLMQNLGGESLLQLLRGKDWQRDQPIYWEHEGNAALRFG